MSRKGEKELPLESDRLRQEDISHHTDGRTRVFDSPWLANVVLVAAVLVSYANSLRCPFVFDDQHDIIDNPSIRHLWPLWDVFLARSQSTVGLQSRPVVNLSFALNYAIGDLNTWSYHVTNLAIHVLAGLAFFGVVRRTFLLPRFRDRFGRASVPLALAVALLWAVHPLQTESVTYTTQRYESLMGCFYLVAVYGLIRSGDSKHSYSWGAVTVAAALLSLGSKEVAVSLPIVILLCDRVLLTGSFSEIWRRRWAMYLGLLAVWAAFAMLQFRAGPRPWAGYALPVSWFEYARSQPGVILHYLRLVFWPFPLVLDYGWQPAWTVGNILPGAVVVTGLLAATGYALWRWPAWGLLGAWFFLILAPTSSVMPLADLAFEHRMYLPLAAVAAAVVLGVYCVSEALAVSARCRAIVLGCLLSSVGLALAILTWQRNNDYRDGLLIWQNAVAWHPNNPRAQYNLGLALAGRGQVDEAIAHYRKALAMWPEFAEAHNNLGIALAGRGDVDEAFAHFRKVLKIKPEFAEAHNNFGIALAGRGQVDEAIAHFRRALEIKPDYAEAHSNLGFALAGRGQVDEAIAHYQKGLETKPDFLAAYCNVNLGIALAGRGQVDEAISHYRKALEIKPDFVQALNSMAWIRATYSDPNFRDGPQAVTLSRQALELSPNDAGVMDTLAAAYAEANRFAEAVQTARKALDLARQHHKKDLAESIQAKILLYDAGIPFHEPPSSPVKASIQP